MHIGEITAGDWVYASGPEKIANYSSCDLLIFNKKMDQTIISGNITIPPPPHPPRFISHTHFHFE